MARRPYRACALPPGLHLGIGRKRERETGTSPGPWCGERLSLRRGEGAEARGPSVAAAFQLPSGEERGKGGGWGGSEGCHPRTPV